MLLRSFFESGLILLTACGKPFWNVPLPTLTDEPMPAGWSAEMGVYALVLAPERGRIEDHPVRAPIVLAESTVTGEGPARFDRLLEGRWPDSVRASFDSAFADLSRSNQPRLVDRAVVEHLPIEIGGRQPSKCAGKAGPLCEADRTFVRVSPIGFNGDSTYAVIYRATWCGPLCGTGVIFLLRRKPNARWCVWSAKLLWIS
jgi:hypothetical protein